MEAMLRPILLQTMCTTSHCPILMLLEHPTPSPALAIGTPYMPTGPSLQFGPLYTFQILALWNHLQDWSLLQPFRIPTPTLLPSSDNGATNLLLHGTTLHQTELNIFIT